MLITVQKKHKMLTSFFVFFFFVQDRNNHCQDIINLILYIFKSLSVYSMDDHFMHGGHSGLSSCRGKHDVWQYRTVWKFEHVDRADVSQKTLSHMDVMVTFERWDCFGKMEEEVKDDAENKYLACRPHVRRMSTCQRERWIWFL